MLSRVTPQRSKQARLVIAGLVHIFRPLRRALQHRSRPARASHFGHRRRRQGRGNALGIPSAWSKTLHINAQAENIHKTATFKPLLGQRLPGADGRLLRNGKPDKSLLRFVRRRRELFCVAGLWKQVEKPGIDLPLAEKCFVLLTTAANPSGCAIHDRMPFILRPRTTFQSHGLTLKTLSSQLLSEALVVTVCPNSREVNNNVRNGTPTLIRPAPVEIREFVLTTVIRSYHSGIFLVAVHEPTVL